MVLRGLAFEMDGCGLHITSWQGAAWGEEVPLPTTPWVWPCRNLFQIKAHLHIKSMRTISKNHHHDNLVSKEDASFHLNKLCSEVESGGNIEVQRVTPNILEDCSQKQKS